jgi:hypothetical protein
MHHVDHVTNLNTPSDGDSINQGMNQALEAEASRGLV